jgi:hypothetical protein
MCIAGSVDKDIEFVDPGSRLCYADSIDEKVWAEGWA